MEQTTSTPAPDAAGRDDQAPPEIVTPERVFARRIRRERQRRGWRQEDLAARLAEAALDLHPSAIAKIEREPDLLRGVEPRAIRLNEASTIANVLELTIDQMLSDRDDDDDPRQQIKRLNQELHQATAERQAAMQSLQMTDQRIADLQAQIERVHKVALTRRNEFLDTHNDDQAQLQRLLAEAKFRTDAVQRQIFALRNQLQIRKNRHPGGVDITQIYEADGTDKFSTALEQTLSAPVSADDHRGPHRLDFRPQARELIIEVELPGPRVVPAALEYQYVRARREVTAKARPQSDINALYKELIARLTIRAIAEAFALTPHELVESVAVNGYVSAVDSATGKRVTPTLTSACATRAAFQEIQLDEPELDPAKCLIDYLNGLVSPHAADLAPIESIVRLSTPSRPSLNLLELTPNEFEHLIRQLLEAIGLESWVTALDEDGVDGMAVDTNPVTGGLTLIECKRYSHVVPAETVRALAANVTERRASKGILVTTSWLSKSGQEFANRSGIIEVIDGQQLAALLQEHLGVSAKIGLPKTPPEWKKGQR